MSAYEFPVLAEKILTELVGLVKQLPASEKVQMLNVADLLGEICGELRSMISHFEKDTVPRISGSKVYELIPEFRSVAKEVLTEDAHGALTKRLEDIDTLAVDLDQLIHLKVDPQSGNYMMKKGELIAEIERVIAVFEVLEKAIVREAN